MILDGDHDARRNIERRESVDREANGAKNASDRLPVSFNELPDQQRVAADAEPAV